MGGRTVWNSEGNGGLSILEFPKARGGLDEDAAHGRVWIFSGITQYTKLLESIQLTLQWVLPDFTAMNLPVICFKNDCQSKLINTKISCSS